MCKIHYIYFMLAYRRFIQIQIQNLIWLFICHCWGDTSQKFYYEFFPIAVQISSSLSGALGAPRGMCRSKMSLSREEEGVDEDWDFKCMISMSHLAFDWC